MLENPILMSVENPDGAKLEEVLERLQLEVNAKTDRLRGQNNPIANTIRDNNTAIVSLLAHAEGIQYETLTLLESLGPDQGPNGTPRI